MHFTSCELRWFAKVECPDQSAFVGELGMLQRERVDQYLLLPGNDSAGIKIRDGKFEIKARCGPSEPWAFGQRAGTTDSWVKWSVSMAEADAMRRTLGAGGDRWAHVRKSRALRVFSLDGPQVTEIAPGSVYLEKGCQVELTSIRAVVQDLEHRPDDGQWSSAPRWWSLSFEAYGPEARSSLDAVARHFLSAAVSYELSPDMSMSYPTWLLQFTK